MPHSINARQALEPIMEGPWPKTSAEIVEWAQSHDALPRPFLNDLKKNLPDRSWNDWDDLCSEIQNYTWTMPDNDEDEDVVWGGATRHDAA